MPKVYLSPIRKASFNVRSLSLLGLALFLSLFTVQAQVPVTGGLVLHLESDQGLSSSGSAVTAWNDQSSSSNDLTAAGGPTLMNLAGPTGLSFVQFDGTDDLLWRSSSISGLPSGGNNRSIFVVVRYRSANWGGVGYGRRAGGQAFVLGLEGSDCLGSSGNSAAGNFVIDGWSCGNNTYSSANGLGAGWVVQSAFVDQGSGTVTMRIDGNVVALDTRSLNTNVQKIVVGGAIEADGSGGRKIDMDVAAILTYDRLVTEGERSSIESFLQSKYIGSSTFPVQLSGFTAESHAQGVTLNWETAQEINFQGFEVQRSVDGRSFESVDWVAGQGQQTGAHYQAVDRRAALGRQAYYRLKMIDLDGTYEYSPVLSVQHQGVNVAANLELFPNPTQGKLTLNLPVRQRGELLLTVMDAMGKRLDQQTIDLDQQSSLELNYPDLTPGVYLLHVEFDHSVATHRFVKQ